MHVSVLVLVEAEDEGEAFIESENNCYSVGDWVFDYVTDDSTFLEPFIQKKDGTLAYICKLEDYSELKESPYFIVSYPHIDEYEYFTGEEWDGLIEDYIKELSEKESDKEKWMLILDAHI